AGPGTGHERAAGIAVDRIRVADPAAQAWRVDLAAEDADPVHLPGQLLQQVLHEVTGPGRRQPPARQVEAGIREVEALPFHRRNASRPAAAAREICPAVRETRECRASQNSQPEP